MNDDVADGLLLDVRGVSLAELPLDDGDYGDESSLDRALKRLLASNIASNYNSFSSSI